jgi:hypothetical protein
MEEFKTSSESLSDDIGISPQNAPRRIAPIETDADATAGAPADAPRNAETDTIADTRSFFGASWVLWLFGVLFFIAIVGGVIYLIVKSKSRRETTISETPPGFSQNFCSSGYYDTTHNNSPFSPRQYDTSISADCKKDCSWRVAQYADHLNACVKEDDCSCFPNDEKPPDDAVQQTQGVPTCPAGSKDVTNNFLLPPYHIALVCEYTQGKF